ncbi:MAG: hypothetical protein EOO65_02010, partial [Methanosarcinales archaeon]
MRLTSADVIVRIDHSQLATPNAAEQTLLASHTVATTEDSTFAGAVDAGTLMLSRILTSAYFSWDGVMTTQLFIRWTVYAWFRSYYIGGYYFSLPLRNVTLAWRIPPPVAIIPHPTAYNVHGAAASVRGMQQDVAVQMLVTPVGGGEPTPFAPANAASYRCISGYQNPEHLDMPGSHVSAAIPVTQLRSTEYVMTANGTVLLSGEHDLAVDTVPGAVIQFYVGCYLPNLLDMVRFVMMGIATAYWQPVLEAATVMAPDTGTLTVLDFGLPQLPVYDAHEWLRNRTLSRLTQLPPQPWPASLATIINSAPRLSAEEYFLRYGHNVSFVAAHKHQLLSRMLMFVPRNRGDDPLDYVPLLLTGAWPELAMGELRCAYQEYVTLASSSSDVPYLNIMWNVQKNNLTAAITERGQSLFIPNAQAELASPVAADAAILTPLGSTLSASSTSYTFAARVQCARQQHAAELRDYTAVAQVHTWMLRSQPFFITAPPMYTVAADPAWTQVLSSGTLLLPQSKVITHKLTPSVLGLGQASLPMRLSSFRFFPNAESPYLGRVSSPDVRAEEIDDVMDGEVKIHLSLGRVLPGALIRMTCRIDMRIQTTDATSSIVQQSQQMEMNLRTADFKLSFVSFQNVVVASQHVTNEQLAAGLPWVLHTVASQHGMNVTAMPPFSVMRQLPLLTVVISSVSQLSISVRLSMLHPTNSSSLGSLYDVHTWSEVAMSATQLASLASSKYACHLLSLSSASSPTVLSPQTAFNQSIVTVFDSSQVDNRPRNLTASIDCSYDLEPFAHSAAFRVQYVPVTLRMNSLVDSYTPALPSAVSNTASSLRFTLQFADPITSQSIDSVRHGIRCQISAAVNGSMTTANAATNVTQATPSVVHLTGITDIAYSVAAGELRVDAAQIVGPPGVLVHLV